jgi:hypothetical protein
VFRGKWPVNAKVFREYRRVEVRSEHKFLCENTRFAFENNSLGALNRKSKPRGFDFGIIEAHNKQLSAVNRLISLSIQKPVKSTDQLIRADINTRGQLINC